MNFCFHPRLLLCPLLLVAALLLPTADAQPSEAALDSFEQGNKHYKNGRYEAALAAYRNAQNAGVTGAAIFFNQGNVFYRLNRHGEARLAYERASRLRPHDSRIRHNIDQLKQKLPDSFAERPTPFWTRWWQTARRHWSAMHFFLMGMALYLGGLGLVGVGLFAGTKRTWRRGLAGLLISGAVVLFGAAFLASWQKTHSQQAVVMAQETSLRSQPSEQGQRSRKLHAGVLLHVQRTDSTWTHVQLPNGETGWLPASSVEHV